MKTSCDARPVHTSGQDVRIKAGRRTFIHAKTRQPQGDCNAPHRALIASTLPARGRARETDAVFSSLLFFSFVLFSLSFFSVSFNNCSSQNIVPRAIAGDQACRPAPSAPYRCTSTPR